jgi:diguanylate cyclase (GGDEF)-like protein
MHLGDRVTAWRSLLIASGMLMSGVTATTKAADAPPLILEHLTTSDGLPQGTVYSTLQDSQGFIWLGTEDGLVRYDGHELVRYAYSRDARNSLSGNFVYEILEDGSHDLWLALKDAGLARWNRASDSFTVWRHQSGRPGSLSSDAARTLAASPQGQIWIGTSDAGINVLDPKTQHIEHLRHDDSNPASLVDDRILSLRLDRSGRMWAGTEKGLDRWDPRQRVFVHYGAVSGNQITVIHEDRAGTLWVGSFDGGLAHLDEEGRPGQVYRHNSQDPASLASDDIRAVLDDHAGHLWVGTPEGLDLLDPATRQFVHYRQHVVDADSLRDSYIMSLFEDQSGLVWIGTRSGGVSRWNPHSWELGGHRPEWLGGRPVTSFAAAPDNQVWISSLGGGLMLFDGATGKATDLDTLLHEDNALHDKRVMSLLRDRLGNLWIGTMTDGLWVLTAAGRLESIPVEAGDSRGISAAGIMTLFQSRNGSIWIGTHGGGANILDPTTRQVRQIPFDPAQREGTGFPHVSAFAEDSRGNVWIGTDGGGLLLAKSDGRVVGSFHYDSKDRHSLPANTVFSINVDSHDRVWIGTDGGGLAKVVGTPANPGGIYFEAITRQQGLSSDTIYGVLADGAERLWLSGNAGLIRFEPNTGAMKTYHRQHGLQGEEFDFNAYFRLPDGRLCFGGPGGFNIFDPTHVTENRTPPRLALTQVTVMGVPLSADTPPWLLTRLSLNFRANIVSLDFGALDFISPKRNRIAYRMSGLTDRWIDVGVQRRVTLTNLDAGDHLLEVRAANADSIWTPTPFHLIIHRDPAPWRSWWAYAAYLIAIMAIVIRRIRVQRERFRAVIAEQQRLEASAKALTERIVQVNTLVEALPDRLWVVDAEGHVQWSPNADTTTAITPPAILPDALYAIGQTAADGKQRNLEYREDDAGSGSRHSYEMRFTRREGGDVVIVRQDTSERTAAAEHIERLAYMDVLTGLPNRQRCIETATAMFSDARDAGEAVAVLYMDLNSFKRVNDTFGHTVGDGVLRIVASTLERALEPTKLMIPQVFLARFGGDEFVVLLRSRDARAIASRLAQQICTALEKPTEYNSLEFYVTPSLGLALFPDDGADVTTVFKHADTAMYHAKGGSSGAIAEYTPAMSSRLRDWLDLEARLRRAVNDGILGLHFQPKFRLRDNQIAGVEALLRWTDSEHGDISPARFIEIAEDSGLIIDIGSWLARAACRHLRKWMDAGYAVPIAINVSPKELLHGDPARVIEAEAAMAGVPTSLIEIEITESLLAKDSTTVQGALQRLRKLGCKIALDDFGTGYSSLAYITRFPPNRIKIDKAFVRNVDESAGDAAIAMAILSLGSSLNLTVTAEGVEREGQLEWLRSRGCDEVQGFLLSRPLTAQQLEERLLQKLTPLDETHSRVIGQ